MLFRAHLLDLTQAGVRFVVIGGVAAGLHGSTRATFDLDVCYDPALDNRERLAALLRSWDAYLRGVEPGPPFELDARTLATSHVLTLTTRLGDIDVMDRVAGVGDFAAVLAGSVEFDVGDGLRCWILDLPALIRAKRAAGRAKDKAQLPELEALLELTRRRRR
jgi:hypothetical protein